MRLTIGKWLIGAGIGIAGLGSVAVALQAPILGWIVFFGGIVLALFGAGYMFMGETQDERQAREHARVVERNRLETERDELSARLTQIDADLAIQEEWLRAATSYGDELRAGARRAEIAKLHSERLSANRRIAQIEAELATA